MQVPRSNSTALWLGAILIGAAAYMIVRMPSWGIPIMVETSIGITLLALGTDARRMWRAADAVKVGLIAGGCVTLLVAMVAERVWLAPIAGLICVGVAAYIGWTTEWIDGRLVRKMVAAHRARQPIEPFAIDAVKSSRRVVFEVAFLLVEWNRYEILEQLATYAFVPHAESLRKFYLALALFAKGRNGEAMELARTANQLDQGPFVYEQWQQLVARIQVANGKASEVIASFSPRCTVPHPGLAVERQLVLADAYATVGDAKSAKRIIMTIASSRAFVEKLQASTRPAATIATKLLSQPDSPYR